MRVLLLILFFAAGSALAQTWLQLAAFPGPSRDDGVVAVVNGKAYVGSGLQTGWILGGDFYSFDLGTQTWTPIASMPQGTERQYANAFKGPNCFYVFGGDGASGLQNTLYKYDVVGGSWAPMNSKPGAGIYGASCFEFGDRIIVCGGRFSGNITSQEVWEYQISTDTWTQKNNMPVQFGGRWRAGYTVLLGKGYTVFGLDANNAWRKELLEYDPTLDSWSKIADLNISASRAYSSLQTLNGQLFLFAGMDSLGTYYNSAWTYDLVSGNWTGATALPTTARRGGMSWTYLSQYYYSCGLDLSETRLNETWTFDLPVGWIENKEESAVHFGPNPCSDIVSIGAEPNLSGVLCLEIRDPEGRILIARNFEKKAGLNLDTSELKAGLYFLSLSDDSQKIKRIKLIRQ